MNKNNNYYSNYIYAHLTFGKMYYNSRQTVWTQL